MSSFKSRISRLKQKGYNIVLDHIKENIIEITMVYCQLRLDVEDNISLKQTICSLADEFEKLHKDIEWGGVLDYYIEIEKFARDKLIEKFGI